MKTAYPSVVNAGHFCSDTSGFPLTELLVTILERSTSSDSVDEALLIVKVNRSQLNTTRSSTEHLRQSTRSAHWRDCPAAEQLLYSTYSAHGISGSHTDVER